MKRTASLLLGTLLLTGPSIVLAADNEPTKDAGARALRESARFPWYDADRDELEPVRIHPYDPPPQAYDWELSLQQRSTWQWSTIWKIVEYFMWAALAAIFALGLYLLIRAISRRYIPEHGLGDDQFEDHLTEADRIENLPFQVKQPRTDLLAEARRHYELGNYQEAIVYLFSYQLVKLDESHLIRLAKGKTNRQYLSEIAGQGRLRRLMMRTMLAFEDVFFGHHPLEKQRFETCWNELDEFHTLVQPRA